MILNVITAPERWASGVGAGTQLYVLESSYAERETAKAAKFRWNPYARRWFATDPDAALRLIEHATPECAAVLERLKTKKIETIAASSASSADIDLPKPWGLDYLPYQKAGIAFGLDRQNVLLCDEPGLGKTIQAIGYINANPAIKSALVICPATLKLNWARECRRWLTRPMSVGVVTDKWTDADVVIVNYDILKKWRASIDSRTWDLLITDEAHYLKNGKAQRTGLVLGKWNREADKRIAPIAATHKWYLTGTPIVNRPSELWTLLHSIDPDTWKSWKFFHERYCGATQTRYGWEMGEPQNLDELQMKLRSTVMVRRLKMDVLKELPPKRRILISLPADSCASELAQEKAEEQAIEDRTSELRANLELAKAESDESYRAAVDAMSRDFGAGFIDLARIRHMTATAKAPLVADYCKELLEGVSKLVIFAHHRDVIEILHKELNSFGCVGITGETPMADRQSAVDRFQSDPNCRVFIGNIQAAGVGITLTAASTVIFAELDWVPGNISQAEDRCHRIGQTDSVTVYHVVLEDSIDEKLATTLIDKQDTIDKALNGGGQSVEDASKPVLYQVECATKSTTREQVAKEAESLTIDQVLAIHEALRFLAAMDQDHARAVNGVGYSKIDGKIGHSLAESPMLSRKQAALGKRIVLKYRRQLSESLVTCIKGE